jgi:sirohydrochlorin ferrochelatase
VRATLLIAAHGTRSAAGSATTVALAAAVQADRPDTPVELCFLDVATPSLADALDRLGDAPVVVLPLLLSAGYHVETDIPAVVAQRHNVRVARHLGPDPAIVDAVAQRLHEAGGSGTGVVLLAAIASSRSSARAEVDVAAARLSARLARPVSVLPLGNATDLPDPVPPIATYLLAEGGFLDGLRARVRARGVVAAPIGVHPDLVRLVWERCDEVNRSAP